MDLKIEANMATEMLKGKAVAKITRRRREEVSVEFVDGSKLYVNGREDGVRLLIQAPNHE